MSSTFSTYYNLVKTRESSPEIMDWAATDKNVEVVSNIMKSFEQHAHTGVDPLPTPVWPTCTNESIPNYKKYLSDCTTLKLTEVDSGGSLAPGTTVGVRLSFSNAMGLETAATTEQDITLGLGATRPLTPIFGSTNAAANALTGGTYMYVMTKTAGGGETDPSDALNVTVPYDQTYSATITFDALSSYSDGTTGYNIYRSAGLTSTFQLITQISDTSTTSFTDTNTVLDPTTQPPSVSTFDSNRQVCIRWTGMTYPADAIALNIYVTQQTGVWSTDHLLTAIDLTGLDVADYYYYQGTESLASGTPYHHTQIPSAPPKVNLGAETTGGFVLTEHGDFVGYQAKNMVLHSTSSPTIADGVIYYDDSIHMVRARIAGTWVNWGTASSTAYSHPDDEVGGHSAASIRWMDGSSTPSVYSILSSIVDGAGDPIQVSTVVKANVTTDNPSQDDSDSSYHDIPDMNITIEPAFDNQWVEITFEGSFQNIAGSGQGTASFMISVDGSDIDETRKYLTLNHGDRGSVSTVYHVQLSHDVHTIKARWSATFSPMTIKAMGVVRSLVAKTIY